MIVKYENNKQEPLMSVVLNLTELLDVSADFLLGRTEIPELADEIKFQLSSANDDNVYPVPVFNSVSEEDYLTIKERRLG